jgi:hypothetical protein
MIKLVLYILIAAFSSITLGAPMKSVVDSIDKVQVMGENYTSYNTSGEAIAFIHMSALPIACENTNSFRRVALTSSHPAFEVVISTALAAKASGNYIELHYLEECTLWNNNAWDFAIISAK